MNDNDTRLKERERYVKAFNDTMVEIWKEKIVLLDAINRGKRYPAETKEWPNNLYDSVVGVRMDADGKFLAVELEQAFNVYGIFVNYGVGKEVYRGNPGDIGMDKRRQEKKWFSVKYYASMKNMEEFYANNVGKDLADTITNAISRQIAVQFAASKQQS